MPIDIMETDFIPVRRFDGVPFLSGQGLWRKDWTPAEVNGIERIHYCLNNSLSVFEIAQNIDQSNSFVRDHITDLVAAGLVEVTEIP